MIVFIFNRSVTFTQKAEHRPKRRTQRGESLPVRVRPDSSAAAASNERSTPRKGSSDRRESGHSVAGESYFTIQFLYVNSSEMHNVKTFNL